MEQNIKKGSIIRAYCDYCGKERELIVTWYIDFQAPDGLGGIAHYEALTAYCNKCQKETFRFGKRKAAK